MSSFGRLLKFFKDRVPFSSRLPTAFSQPKRVRKYEDVRLQEPERISYVQYDTVPEGDELVVLSDISKQCVMLQMQYHDYLSKMTNLYVEEPQFIEKCYDLLQLVGRDQPIRKKAKTSLPLKEKYKELATGGSEREKNFFRDQNTIKLSDPSPSKSLIPKPKQPGSFESQLGTFTIKDTADDTDLEDFLTAEEINRRQIFIWQETKDTFEASEEVVTALATKLGNVYSAMDYIVLKGSQRSPEEQKVVDGMDYVIRLMKGLEEHKKNVARYLMLHPILPFPMPQYLQEMYTEKLRYMWQNCYVENIMPLIGVPDRSEEYDKELELRYQRAMDLEALSEKDRKAALQLIEEKGDELIVRRDLNAKDNALISKMNLLANTVEVKRPPELKLDFQHEFNPDSLRAKLQKQMKVDTGEGLLSPENIVKVLFLNNSRPDEFDLEYWAEVLNLPLQKLRNVFNHISYPVVVNGKAVGKLTFVEVPRKKEVVDLEEENLKQFRLSQRRSSASK